MLWNGHNYGHRYAYVNPQTGRFASQRNLPEQLLWMISNSGSFSPRDWVLQNMSCHKANQILEEAIKRVGATAGEKWSIGLAQKVGYLNTMRYWDEAARTRFEADYSFLRSMIAQ